MSGAECKGNCLTGSYEFMRQKYSADQVETMLARVPPAVSTCWKDASDTKWYPAVYYSEAMRVIAEAHPGDIELARQRVLDVGRYVSSKELAGLYKLLIKFMTPRLLAAKLGDFFSRDFRNLARAKVSARLDPNGKVMHCSFVDMEELPYVACAGQGWVLNGLEGMGCKKVRCEGQDHDWHAADGSFRATWS